MKFFSYIIARTIYIDDNDVHFALDQHAQLDFYSVTLCPAPPTLTTLVGSQASTVSVTNLSE